jgi:hypothetical protein
MGEHTPDRIAAGYVLLRDKIAAMKKRHAAELEPLQTNLKTLNTALLKWLLDQNTDSAKTSGGTVYRINHASATVRDPDAFRSVVMAGEWNLADIRANKPAVQAYVAENGVAPPGVHFEEYLEVGVRRPTGGSSNTNEEA